MKNVLSFASLKKTPGPKSTGVRSILLLLL